MRHGSSHSNFNWLGLFDSISWWKTWWIITVSKLVISSVITGLTLPTSTYHTYNWAEKTGLITGLIIHLLSNCYNWDEPPSQYGFSSKICFFVPFSESTKSWDCDGTMCISFWQNGCDIIWHNDMGCWGCWSEYVVEGQLLMLLDCTLWNWQTLDMPSLSNSNAMAMLVLRAGPHSYFYRSEVTAPNADEDGDRINDMEVAMMVEGLKVNRNKTTWCKDVRC